MSTHSRPLYPVHSFPQHWSAQDLADAVPLRLSDRVSLGLVEFAPPLAAANHFIAMRAPRGWRRVYARSAELPAFVRVR